jgi:DNA ligase-1
MTTLPVLYKKTSTGKIQQWSIETIREGNAFRIVTTRGQIDGKKNSDGGKLITEGKNIGKANETTPKDQAILEAASKWEKKKDEGYYDSIEAAQNLVKVLPMLAHDYNKRGKSIDFPCIGQPKLDGVRCLGFDGGRLMSRKGKDFPHLDHIKKEVASIIEANPNIILDGELFSDELTFEEIVGMVRRETLKTGDAEKILKVKYYVYDCFRLDDPECGFINRYNQFHDVVKACENLVVVPNYVINDKADIPERHATMIKQGHEGLIVRNMVGPYKINGRSKDLQKYKHFEDGEFKIIGCTQGEGGEEGCIVYVCETDEGKEFKARPRGTREERQELFKKGSSLVGKMLTVRYFEMTNDNIPRFPVGLTVRDYE